LAIPTFQDLFFAYIFAQVFVIVAKFAIAEMKLRKAKKAGD
jgi:hypothetical protein